MNILRVLLALLVIGFASVAPSLADDPVPVTKIEKRQLLVPRKGEGAVATGLFEDPAQWLREKQRDLSAALGGSLRGIRGDAPLWAAWSLVLISFGYGVLHAAGPGHGKAVISAWLLATESELKRGVLIAFLSSIVQALSAIAIVSAALFVFSAAISTTRAAAGVLQSASFAMIGAMGLYLVWTALRPKAHAHSHATPAAGHHGQHQDDHHGRAHHHNDDHHDHANCGHSHAPEPMDMRGELSFAKAASMSFAIGIRPCTGAILVLLAAYPLGLYWAGILAAFAMAAGTFITVSIIAALTVYSKQLALKFAGAEKPWFKSAAFAARLSAGALVAVLGGMLFWASLGSGTMAG